MSITEIRPHGLLGQYRTFIALLLLYLAAHGTGVTSEFTVGACFNQTDKALTLNCPQGQMVKVTELLQGHSETGSCLFMAGDCMWLMSDVQLSCVGRHQCQMNLPTGDVGTSIHQCDAYSTYTQAKYDCIEVTEVVDICSRTTLTSQHGYISSTHYPNNHPSNMNCSLTLRAPYPSQRLRITALDLTLEGAPTTGCLDKLALFDGSRGYSTCGTITRREIYITMENYVTFTFTSNKQNNSKGFWIYYEAEPYIESTVPPPTTQLPSSSSLSPNILTTTTTIATVTTGNIIDIAAEDPHVESSPKIPTGLLVGVILGLLLCVVLAILVVIVICTRRRRMKQSHYGTSGSSVAIMAANIAKPVPPQTLNNTLTPETAVQNKAYSHPKSDNTPSLKDYNKTEKQSNMTDYKQTKSENIPSLKDNRAQQDIYALKNVKSNKPMNQEPHFAIDVEKPSYKGPYIDTDLQTGQQQLFC